MLDLNFQNGTTPALNARNMNAIVESINTLDSTVTENYTETSQRINTITGSVDDLRTQLASPFTYKGTVASISNLPSSNNVINDTYFVEDQNCLYSWNGTAWSQSSYDADGYAQDLAELKSALNDESVLVDAQTTTYDNSWIDANGAIAEINGYSRTDYIELENALSFVVSSMNLGNYIYYCFYDDAKSALVVRQRCYNDTPVAVPNGAVYLIVASSTANINSGTVKTQQLTRITLIENKVDSYSKINALSTINPTALLIDRVIKASNGSVSTSDVFVCTDFLDIPFEENQPIDVIGSFVGIGGCAIYNSKKQIILGIDGNNVSTYGGTSGLTIQRITVPYQSGMKYIRISGVKTLVNNDPSKLGIIGCTFNGVYKDLFNLNEKVNANIPNIISKSKVLVVGDSISADAYGDYSKWVTDLIQSGFLPADTNNSSQHATGFVATANGTYDNFVTRLKAVENPSTYDLVIVFGGINDYLQNIPMGEETGTDFTTSFKPAVNEFFGYLVENFTQARLCVFLPLRTYHTNKNTQNEYQQAYGDYIKQVAKSYCLPVLNLTEESGFFPFNEAFKNMWTLLPSGQTSHDGVHPNEEYEAKYLAPMIQHFLQGMM